MPPPNPEQIADFLKTLGNLLHEQVTLPDFTEMFASQPTPGPDSPDQPVIQATPDQIEAAVVIALQRVELARADTAEAKRVQAQWDIVSSAADGHDAPPEHPHPADLAIVDPATIPDIDTLNATATKALQTLTAARGEPDEAFQKATEAAFTAIQARNDAVAVHHTAIGAERQRRREAIDKLGTQRDQATSEIPPRLADALASTDKPPTKAIGTLKTHLAETTKLLDALPALVETALPGAFEAALGQASQSVGQIEAKLANPLNWASTATVKDQKTARDKLPKAAPALPPGAREMVDAKLIADYDDRATAYKDALANFAKLVLPHPEDEFEAIQLSVTTPYDQAEEAADAIVQAAKTQTDSRRKQLEERQNAGAAIVRPKNKLTTPEATTLANAEKAFKTALDALAKLIASGTAVAFKAADDIVAKSLLDLETAAKKIDTDATERADKTNKQIETAKKSISDTAGPPLNALNKSFPKIVAALRAALIKSNEKIKLVDGIDPAADTAILQELDRAAGNAKSICESITKIDPALLALTANNADVVGLVEKLIAQISGADLARAPASVDGGIPRKCQTVATSYDELDDLEDLYTQATDDETKNYARKSQAVLADYPATKQHRQTFGVADLNKRITAFQNAIDEINEARADAEDMADTQGRPKYNESACLPFVNGWRIGDTAGDLLQLLKDGKAKAGARMTAYRTSHDRPDGFSIEIPVRIEGWSKIVLHAHCDKDSVPKSGNACHIKLKAQRMVQGVSVELTTDLRNRLLPQQLVIYETAKKMKFVK